MRPFNQAICKIFYAAFVLAVLLQSGCSTLSSLGLPFASSTNQIIKSARDISDAPGQALLMPSELTKLPLNSYVVEIGDTIFVEAVSFDANIRLPGDQIIKPDGTISIGEFGRFDAVNKTIEQIQMEVQSLIDEKVRSDLEQEFAEETARERQLKQVADRPSVELDEGGENSEIAFAEAREREGRLALELRKAEQIKKNKISVRLVNWESKKIYVLGEVNSPGYFAYLGNQTVLDAIVEAGGLTGKANHHQIIVARPTACGSCRIVMKVCYDQVVQLGDTSTNYQLMPGDRVFVPNLTFMDDLKKTLSLNRNPSCPRCAPCQQGCDLPTGCQQ
ncbi:MAG: SLBB domain-containing protein [Mariniblastus sp.]